MASSSPMDTGTAPPPHHPTPPLPTQESSYAGVNFAVGAYLLMGKRQKKNVGTVEAVPVPPTSTSTSTPAAAVVITENPVTPPPTMEPVPRAPIPEEQQRELYK